MPYKIYISTNAPTVLQGPNAKPKIESYGELQDIMVDRTREGILARFPEEAPADALQYIETERGIDRALGDTDAEFATRLKEAWSVWPFCGSARGFLKALKDQGHDVTKMYLFQQNGLYWQIDSGTDEVTSTALDTPFDYWLDDPARALDFWTPFSVVLSEPPAFWQTYDTATFNDTQDYIDITWARPFDTNDYLIASGLLTTDGSLPIIVISNKTRQGIRVNAGIQFFGTVDVLAWDTPHHPLASPRPSDVAKLCRLANRWKAGRSLFYGFIVLLDNMLWGFPVTLDWGDVGVTWGGRTAGSRIGC